jgi:hypothetical protein
MGVEEGNAAEALFFNLHRFRTGEGCAAACTEEGAIFYLRWL